MASRESVEKRRTTEHSTSSNIITIEKYLSSKVRENMLRAIVECNKNKITQREYYEFRAALIGEIIFRNAQQSGVILG